MGIANNWTMRIKRKDNQPLTQEQIDTILEFDIYEDSDVDELFIVNYKYPEYEISFYTDSYSAVESVEAALLEFTKGEPMISIQTDCFCTEYDGDDFVRTNYSNGKSENMIGYITFPDPEEIFY